MVNYRLVTKTQWYEQEYFIQLARTQYSTLYISCGKREKCGNVGRRNEIVFFIIL